MVKTGIGSSDAVPEDWESFSGIHLATDRPLKWLISYGFYLDDAFADITQKLGTVGGRVLLFPTDGLKLSVEAAAQFGRVTAWDADAVLQVRSPGRGLPGQRIVPVPEGPDAAEDGLFFFMQAAIRRHERPEQRLQASFGSTHNFLGYMDRLRPSGVWDIV